MRLLAYILVTLTGWLGFISPAWAFTSAASAYPAVRAPHALALDPSLSDPAWQAGQLPEAAFADLTTRGPAPHATRVYLLYDDTNLYVGFKMEQRGTPLVASQATNDVGFGSDDFVGVGLDPGGSGAQVYFFEVTPRGVRYEQAAENVRYRPQWQAAATPTADGWNAVMILPLHVLRISSTRSDWRINFLRAVASSGEHYSWSFDGIMQDASTANGWPLFTDARFWPHLTGVRAKIAAASRPKTRLDVYGLSSSGGDRTEFVQANGAVLQQNPRVTGLDVSVPLTSTMNFVGTLAPDFSNVEIDQQTIAPQEFQRALLEYRPFFSQGAAFINPNSAPVGGILGAANVIFYSPGVGTFDYGGKVEGTFGDQSLGLLNFRGYDQTTGNEFDDTAFGYKHSVPDRTFMYWGDGVLAHHSVFGDDTTLEGGVAGRNLKTGLVWALDDAVETGTFLPGGIAHSTNGLIDFHKPNWETLLSYVDISPNYGPIDGFTTNSDIRGLTGFVNLLGATPGIKNFGLFAAGDRYTDESGAVHQADSGIFLNATFKDGISLNGAGPQVGLLRNYAIPAGPGCSGKIIGSTYYTGFPCYLDGRTDAFNLFFVPVGYRDGSPSPTDGSFAWGTFGRSPVDNGIQYVHLFTLTHSLPLTRMFSVGLEYDGTYERDLLSGVLESQWLRRVSLGINLSPDSNATLSFRSINGIGGFSPQQGHNIAAAFHKRFKNGNELYVNYGTPAAYTTLNRLIVKYLFHVGADAGT
jgi:hypothetical protein